MIAMPTLEGLLGSTDYCACEHCRSVLSPAAYLVDLLEFADRPAGALDGKENPLSVLLERRPDLEHLPLTCENTHTAMPYIDVNPKGNGYYTLRERPFAIVTWLFGFLILWVVLIFFGTFLRGPNWEFFGPYEYWDAHKASALNNVDVSNFWWNIIMDRARPTKDDNPIGLMPYWFVREWLGFLLVGAYMVLLPVVLRFTVFRRMYENMGLIRYVVMVSHLLLMAMMPIKMVLRWLFNLKYFIYLPEFNANL